MFARAEHFADSRTTTGTVLTRELRCHLHHLPTSFCRFVRQDQKEGVPRRVTDRFGQMMILHQALDVEVFDRDSVKPTHEPERYLVPKILSLPPDFLMLFGEQRHGFAVTVTALVGAARGFAVCRLQAAFGLLQEARVLNGFPCRERGEVLQSDIQPDARASLRQVAALILFNGKDDVPAVRLALDHAGLDRPCDRTAQAHAARADFGQVQFVTFQPEARLRVAKGVIARLPLESWVACRLSRLNAAKEGLKGLLQAAQHILCHLAVDLCDIFAGRFNLRQLSALGVVVERNAIHPPSVTPFLQRAVVKLAANIQGLLTGRQKLRIRSQLIFIGFHAKSVLDGNLHMSKRIHRALRDAQLISNQAHQEVDYGWRLHSLLY